MDFTIDWLIALLVVHVIGLAALIYLFHGAPCWMQKVSVMLLGISFVFASVAFVAAIAHVDKWWGFLIVAAAFEHSAVLLYIFRVWWQGEQQKWNFSIRSRRSPT